MKAESEHLFRRGRRGILYLRKRIPLHLLDAYPRGKAEILVSLRTSDEDLAKQRLLETDDHLRQQGLDDDEFEELGERLVGQPKELWQLPARGQSQRLLPAMLNFVKLCGVEAVPPAHEQRRDEVAGLMVDDVRHDAALGWYLHITDLPSVAWAARTYLSDVFSTDIFLSRPYTNTSR